MGEAYLVSTMVGVLKSSGVLSETGQRVVRQHCEAGRTQQVVEAVAAVLLSQGMLSGKIPHNTGIKEDKDLAERSQQAIYETVKEYHDKGGVLLAKGYTRPLELIAEMAKQWLRTFSPRIPDKEKLSRFGEEELSSRLALAAMAIRDRLLRDGEDDGDHIRLDKNRLEGLCRGAALDMFQAFEDPNTANHAIVHGDE